MKEIAQARLGRPIRKAVITVPAYFSDTQRQATREAGEIAGLEVARIINEPTAAALVYEAAQHQGKRILVYDLGGGTFDVSVVRIEQGVVEVISSHGNNHLGGDDFDHKIVEHVLEHLKLKHGVDVADRPQAMARILRSAEDAKKQLSDHPYARIAEEYLAEHGGQPVNLDLELSREEYEDMIAPFIEETLGAIHIALEFGGPDLLAGGRDSAGRWRNADAADPASSGGGVRHAAPRRSRSRPVRCHGGCHPGRRHGGNRGVGRAGRRHALYLRDERTRRAERRTLSLSICSDHSQEYPDPGARRAKCSSPSSTSRPTLTFGSIRARTTMPLENIKIGEFRVYGLSKAPAGNPVIVDLALDRNGILQVSAREKKTGLERRITIDNATSRYDQEQLDEARQRIGALFGDQEQAASVGSGAATDSAVDALLAKSEREARRDRRGGSHRNHRPDRDDPGCQEQRRQRCPGGRAQPTAGPAFLSRDVNDGALSSLPCHTQWR